LYGNVDTLSSRNLIGDAGTSGGLSDGDENGNIVGQDPLLSELADNGGPTRTHALLPGSPAIDMGDPEFAPAFDPPLLTDQRGYLRVADGDGDATRRIDIGAFEFLSTTPADIIDRHIFYNNSTFDGDNAAANEDDDNAVALDKQALLPGQSATFANYTSYSRGINGLMIDLANLPPDVTPAADDFAFHTGNDNDPAGWTQLNVAPTVTLHLGAGIDGSDRVTIVLPDGAIRNAWLEVTVKAADLNLAADDVFYFGNGVAETGKSSLDATVTTTDLLLTRNNPRAFQTAAVDFPYDFDRDGRVNATDVLLARNNQTSFFNALKLIDLSGEGEMAGEGLGASGEGEEASAQALAWLAEQGLDRPGAGDRTTAAQDAVDVLLATFEW